MRAPVLLLVLAATGFASGGPITTTLVFVGGGTLTDVTAEVQDGFVVVTHNGGRRQAFALEDVDLAASGLVPEAATSSGDAVSPKRIGSAGRLSVAPPAPPKSSVVITDADVEHVLPEAEPEVAAELAVQGLLEVVGSHHSAVGSNLNVTGMVANRSNAVASEVTVTLVAVAANGAILGSTTTSPLPRPVAAGRSVPFSVTIADAADATRVDARAEGAFPEGAVRVRPPQVGEVVRATTAPPESNEE